MLDQHHDTNTPREPFAPEPAHADPTTDATMMGGRTFDRASTWALVSPRWIDGLAPPHLDPLERVVARSIALLAEDDGGLIAVIRRLRAWLDHPGPRLDPLVRDGIDCAHAGLTLLHATRRAKTSLDLAFMHECASAFRGRRDLLASPTISLCIDLDLAGSPCRRSGPGHSFRVAGRGREPLACPSSTRLFGRLGRLWRDREALARAVARYRSVREAYGLGVGLDPDVVAGVGHASDILVLLLAIRPATTAAEGRAKAVTIAEHPHRRADHVGAVLDMCLEHDRAVLRATP